METTKTYSTRTNAIRAARAELGNPQAMDLVQFAIKTADGAFSYELLDLSPAQPPKDNGRPVDEKPVAAARKAPKAKRKPKPEPKGERKPRENTKESQVLALLARKGGATNEQIRDITGWQPHTVRGFLSTRPKALGLSLSRATVDGVSVYRTAPAA